MTSGSTTRSRRVLQQRGFTLIEMLVVVGIISLLTGIILPTTSAARRESRALRCQSNARQLVLAISSYAAEHKNKYPPNLIGPAQQAWFDVERVGAHLPPIPTRAPQPDSTVWVCPEDDVARRSYAMNYWASCKVDFVPMPALGERWGPASNQASQLLLLVESWSNRGSPLTGYEPPLFIGSSGTPGQRFGASGGMNPPVLTRSGPANSELAFARHRPAGAPGTGTQPIGRVTIAFADGHVELLANDDFVEPTTGKLTGLCAWSPFDLR